MSTSTATPAQRAVISLIKDLASELAVILQDNSIASSSASIPERVDSDYLRIRDVLGRLSEQPIDLTILSRTMVGRVVSKLKRCPNASIAAEAKTILKKWRKIAEEENRRIAEKQTARTRAPRGARTEDPAATGKKNWQTILAYANDVR
mmetsp:Transcript_19749/g.57333  ORF Transcript_19749/g.57333 Transcript_19749/m.57333 type:complete len:149 (-) Transcript_19749:538-984(-)